MKTSEAIEYLEDMKQLYILGARSHARVEALQHAIDFMKRNQWQPIEKWHEDMGEAIWTCFPIEEPFYAGSPLCDDWPDYHTHFIPMSVFPQPEELNNDR